MKMEKTKRKDMNKYILNRVLNIATREKKSETYTDIKKSIVVTLQTTALIQLFPHDKYQRLDYYKDVIERSKANLSNLLG